ncbi:MAG: oligosaccharide repeat unit polymerase [Bacteroidaceae bacterium]|nr:oligosaccharide repeat unit polymerase [Bacteroidaceae bacterium]
MWIFLPFVFFLVYFLNRNKDLQHFDIAQFIIVMFGVSSVLSIFIYLLDMMSGDTYGYEISLKTSLIYVSLLFLCIRPFARNSHNKIIKLEPLRKPWIVYLIAVIAFVWFIISILFIKDTVLFVLNGDMGEIRNSIYQGQGPTSYLTSLSDGIRQILVSLNMVFSCPWVSLFLAFFLRYVQKSPIRYSFYFILASLFSPIRGIAGADRSTSAYWIIAVGAMYLFFRHNMSNEERKRILRILLSIVAVMILYLVAMTISRFGTEINGSGFSDSQSSLISYLGQSYINFCYFFDNYQPPYINLGILFPTTMHLLLGNDVGGTIIQQEATLLTGMQTGVFYTFIGHIMVGAGKSIAVAFTLIYALLSSFMIPKITKNMVTADNAFLYIAMCSIVLFGLFAHYYAAIGYMASVILWYIVLRIAK